ncbi:MAG: P1 family peptidase [Chloroflexi bacterium]|nr:P1 family peptidase [Chloroflexota bacterium]
MKHNALTDVDGIQVGHFSDEEGGTGCTVVLCPQGAVAGVDVRGAAPGTRETDLLRPGCLVQRIHALLLTGGSAFGLEAAGGVMRYLEERGVGYPTLWGRVPIVPAAVIFDLPLGKATARPTAHDAYQACRAASSDAVAEGNVGAGTGATVGKALGIEWATKGGLGTASFNLRGLTVAALAVVNAFGDVVNPWTGQTLAGLRSADGAGFLNTMDILKKGGAPLISFNTTLAVVATNAALAKDEANRLAQMAQNGLARALRPAHTMADGDVVFALSVAKEESTKGELTTLGALAAEVTATAIVRAVVQAKGLHGVPAARELVYATLPLGSEEEREA